MAAAATPLPSTLTAVDVKKEVGECGEDEVLGVVSASDEGLDIDAITALTPAMPVAERQEAINSLLAKKKLTIVQLGGGAFRLKVNNNTQLAGVTEEEQAIYSLIEQSKTKGIWIRELRDGSGLSQITLRKVLKQLEGRKLIKAVKAVGTTKKCYMVFDLEPDTSLTGGTFYSDQQLDAELINTLIQVCIGMIQNRRKLAAEQNPGDPATAKELSYVRASEIVDYVREKKILHVQISESDIDRILEVAIYDGAIERRSDGKVRAAPPPPTASPLVTIPCATCPVIGDCKPGHVISPETCRYMADWLAH